MSDDGALPPSYEPRRGRRRGQSPPPPSPDDRVRADGARANDRVRADGARVDDRRGRTPRQDVPGRARSGGGDPTRATPTGRPPVRRSVRGAPTRSPRDIPSDTTGIPSRPAGGTRPVRGTAAGAARGTADGAAGRTARGTGGGMAGGTASMPAGAYGSAGAYGDHEHLPPSHPPPSYPPRRSGRGGGSATGGQGGGRGADATRVLGPAVAPARGYADHPGGHPDGYPGGYDHPPEYAEPDRAPRGRAPRRRRRRRAGRVVAFLLVLVLAAVIGWPVGLGIWADRRIQHVDALSGAPDTAGTTYVLAGSDQRGGAVADGVEGSRADSIMVLHVPEDGTVSMVSLPRDTYVTIPGHGDNKLNAAYSYGGAELLVATVEGLMGLTVDHYVEIGMSGLADIVDAVGGVELCLDYDVDDDFSGLQWQAGCARADGETALAFSRMRYSDPTGDIGRGQRQRQVIGAIAHEVARPATLLDPRQHVSLARTGTDVLATDHDTGIVDLGRLALAFRRASGSGFVGTPPIASPAHSVPGVGSTVLLDTAELPAWLESVRDGTIAPSDPAPEAAAGATAGRAVTDRTAAGGAAADRAVPEGTEGG